MATTPPAAESPQPAPPPGLPDRRANMHAHTRLANKLQELGRLANLNAGQVSVGSREREGDAFRNPATNAARLEAYELATRIEATLPDHSGTALAYRAELVMFLLDPGGAERLDTDLRRARQLFS